MDPMEKSTISTGCLVVTVYDRDERNCFCHAECLPKVRIRLKSLTSWQMNSIENYSAHLI